jgi:hypothetical protein
VIRPERPDDMHIRFWTCLGAVILISSAPAELRPEVRIRPRIYAGAGFGRTLDANSPAFAVDDIYDRNFVDANLSPLKRNFTRGQIRLDLVQAGAFSAGYLYWGHYHAFPADYPEYWLKTGKWYPNTDHAAVHALTVQWNPRFLAGKRLAPFVLAGAGGYYGNVTSIRYFPVDSSAVYYYGSSRQISSDAGRAVLGGIGVVAFRYAYLYAGVVHLIDAALPAKTYLDVILGVTF